MKRLTLWIASRLIPDHDKTSNMKVRARYGVLEGWTSIVINSVLFVAKIVIGLMIGSVSLIADAVHTLSDCVTSIVIVVGFKIAKKPSDKEHPFGHGRMEAIATIIVSVLLIVAGVELFKSSFDRLLHPTHVDAGAIVTIVLIATIAVKEMLAQFSRDLGRMIDSKALEADFWHHRSDVIATGLVVIALVASDFGYTRLDGIAGLLVSLIVAYSGYVIAKESISPLLGPAPPPEMLKRIEEAARSIPGVEGVHDVIVHQYGLTNLVSLHIEVAGDKDVTKLHDISEEVELKVGGNVHGTVVAHIDPLNKNHKRYPEVERAVAEIVAAHRQVTSFHDLRIVGRGKLSRVIFDVNVDDDTDELDIYDIRQAVIASFKQRFPDIDVVVKVEPKFSYQIR